ncbi:hypothetical protein A374_06956 [Fictibacillus macauensis ZFHKF-1]|uniref:Uncharacterized protein n=1 Tax=Fictibacillus macauensis ZFHKF-1 TaxID=1196324 RepID=I8AKF6_9BACL|nr:hypothetical protein [Fictibacillus macauensis]EIT86039.1 hypothetical protein A374_06956 [Fictibacillus macauensis ZFHKF-1]
MKNYLNKHRVVFSFLVVLYAVCAAVTGMEHSLLWTGGPYKPGINSFLFLALFSDFELLSGIIPLFIIILVSDLMARHWFSDMKVWSIIRGGYAPFIRQNFLNIILVITAFIVVGDLLSLIGLMIVDGNNWTMDSYTIAPGLGGHHGPILTMLLLFFFQWMQAIFYAFATFVFLLITKRIWETIVYPFLFLIVVPILLVYVLDFMSEKYLFPSITAVLVQKNQSNQPVIDNLTAWIGGSLLMMLVTFVILTIKKRKGLVR